MNTSRVIGTIFLIFTIIKGSDQEVMKFMSNFSAAQPQSIWRPSILLYFFPLLIIGLAATRKICTDCHLIYGQ
ncbi:unnamed protein product [Auanema sp. JU1783]|nr:unnamed protein product [Auanema sp. JU1783]